MNEKRSPVTNILVTLVLLVSIAALVFAILCFIKTSKSTDSTYYESDPMTSYFVAYQYRNTYTNETGFGDTTVEMASPIYGDNLSLSLSVIREHVQKIVAQDRGYDPSNYAIVLLDLEVF